MRLTLHRCLLLVAALVAAAPASAQQGALTIHRNLGQLTDSAAHIVRGNVVSAVVEKHPQFTALDTVVVTLRIRSVLKGEAGSSYTFRQHIPDLRSRLNAGGYRKGQDLLLFINPASRYALTSPTGLAQGRFLVVRDAAGREVAINGNANAMLFSGLEADASRRGVAFSAAARSTIAKHSRGPIPLDQLILLVRELAGGAR